MNRRSLFKRLLGAIGISAAPVPQLLLSAERENEIIAWMQERGKNNPLFTGGHGSSIGMHIVPGYQRISPSPSPPVSPS